MDLKSFFTMILMMALVWSCGKNDDSGAPEEENTPPMVNAKIFSVSEAIGPEYAIGIVDASDDDGDDLVFSTAHELFKIGNVSGILSLRNGKSLDFDLKKQHILEVNVSDGKATSSANVIINVTETNPKNQAPEISAQEFKPDENITDADAIGSVAATYDGGNLQYSITEDTSGLFKIGGTDGKLTLTLGKQLDFETTDTYMITVQVSDGELSAEAQMTISVQDVNEAPVIDNTDPVMTTVNEDISDDVLITTITAKDPEGAALQYSIADDPSNLFEVGNDGTVTLQTGKALDYAAAVEHYFTVQVSDGELSVQIGVDLTVQNVTENMFEDNDSFITTWQTTMANEEVRIGVSNLLEYNFTVDWGDDSQEEILSLNDEVYFSHTYDTPGTYQVAIQGQFPRIKMVVDEVMDYRAKLISLDQWGSIPWESFSYAFYWCENMEYNAVDPPNLENVENLNSMFYAAKKVNGGLNNWDVSGIIRMDYMFVAADEFNGDISDWVVENVENMESMFALAKSFDQNIGKWSTPYVETMEEIFFGSGMSATNYANTLIGWSKQPNIPQSIALGALNLEYCDTPEVQEARTILEAASWNFGGDTPVNCN